MNLFEQIGIDGSFIVIGLAVFCIILFSLVLVAFCKIKPLKNRYDVFMKDSNAESLEKFFVKQFGQVDSLIRKTQEIDQRLAKIDDSLLSTYQKMGIVKYDAFDMGGKLSFALALLNEKNDGFILNSVHSTREGCYTYVKEIINGESFVILASEEKEALDMAIQSKM